MPEARPFSTNGVYNGLSGCPPSVDVSGFDYWTTASGYNKDSVGSPTQSQIDQSLHNVGKLFWNLHKVNVDTFYDTNTLTEQFVTGIENGGVDDAIQPDERVCGGSLSTDNVDEFAIGQIDLLQTSGMVRMYNGATTDETKFIGYGFGLVDFLEENDGAIKTSANDGLFIDNVIVVLVVMGQVKIMYPRPLKLLNMSLKTACTSYFSDTLTRLAL